MNVNKNVACHHLPPLLSPNIHKQDFGTVILKIVYLKNDIKRLSTTNINKTEVCAFIVY